MKEHQNSDSKDTSDVFGAKNVRGVQNDGMVSTGRGYGRGGGQ